MFLHSSERYLNQELDAKRINLIVYLLKKLCTKQVKKVKAVNNLIYGNLSKKHCTLYRLPNRDHNCQIKASYV